MALGFLNATPTGFRYGEYIGGVFYGVIVTGVGLTYDVNGVPVGGTLRSMEFENTRLDLTGVRDDIEKITFPKDFPVTALTNKGFDWFASAATDGSEVTIDGTILLTKFDKLGFYGLNLPYDPGYRYIDINTGNQDDRVYGLDNPELLANISTGAGKDKIFASGRDIRVDAGADNDHVTLNSLYSFVIAGTGKDTITVTGERTSIQAGAGDDTVVANISENLIVAAGTGHDHVTIIRAAGLTFYSAVVWGMQGNDTIIGSESSDGELHGDAGNDVINLGGVGPNGSEVAYGGSGNDQLTGGGGTGYQWLLGGSGDDTLTAGTARAQLFGGGDDDLMIGGTNDDAFYIEDGTDTVTTGDGIDIIALYNPASTGTGIVIDFDLANDVIVIDTSANLNAADSYDLFLSYASQVGSDTVYDDGAGRVLILQGINLDDITAANVGEDFINALVNVPPDATQ